MSESIESQSLPKEGEILLIFCRKSELYDAVESLGLGKIVKKESGEPYIPDSPYRISLSHKDSAGTVAISLASVGVDMENVTVPRNVERLSRLFAEEERPETLYDFYRVWTGKEATGKKEGTGITSELLNKRTEGVRYVDFGDYLVCVAGEGEIKIKEYGNDKE